MSLKTYTKQGELKTKGAGGGGGGFPYTLGTYLDLISTVLHTTPPVAKAASVATATNTTISAPGASVGGLALSAGQRVLLTNQTAPEENGLWTWNGAAVPMTRPADFAAASDIHAFQYLSVGVIGGTFAGTFWYLATAGAVTIDTTGQTWTKIALAEYQPLDADLTAIAALAPADGTFIRRTGGVWVAAALVSGDIPDLSSIYQVAGSYQAADSDLSDIAALAPSNGTFIRRTGGVWVAAALVAGDIPDLSATYQVAGSYQPLDSDLTDIAALAPANGTFIRRTGGVWVASALASGDIPDLSATYIPTSALDTDGTLAANSDAKVATQKAVKTYVDTEIAGVSGGGGGSPVNLAQNTQQDNWSGGTAVAPDGYVLTGASATVAQESTIKKIGNYSMKVTRSGTDCYAVQDAYVAAGRTYARGRAYTIAGWVYATVASRVRLRVDDGITVTNSSYHSGGSAWELLTVTITADASATALKAGLQVDTGNTSGYLDGLVIAEGSSALTAYVQSLARDKAFASYNGDGVSVSTSSTTFADADTTNLSRTLDIAGTAVFLTLDSVYMTTSSYGSNYYLDVDVDGTRIGNATWGSFITYQIGPNNVPIPCGFSVLITGLTPGSHTFKIQHKVNSSSYPTTLGNGWRTFFTVREL